MGSPIRSLNELLLMTKDTDPDLRFMALNDLDKEISNVNFSQYLLTEYSKILVKSLKDDFIEVRTQSLKCFLSIASKMDLLILPVLKSLLDLLITELNKEKKYSSITSTNYTMAIHNILHTLPNNPELWGKINQILIPFAIQENKDSYKIDNIEILIDLVENTSKAMSTNELSSLVLQLIDCSFFDDGIISKKALLILPLVLKNIENPNLFRNTFMAKVLPKFDCYRDIKKDKDLLVTLIALLNCGVVGNSVFMSQYTDDIWRIVNFILDLKQGTEDYDYEVQQEIDVLRFNALNLLIKIVECFDTKRVELLLPEIVAISVSFVSYDPYNNGIEQDDDIVVEEEHSEGNSEEYDYGDESDYEQDEDEDGDEYDSIWRLRSESLVLLKTVLKTTPISLPGMMKSNLPLLIHRLKNEQNKYVVISLIETLSYIFELCYPDGIYYNLLSTKSMIETTNGRRNSDISMHVDEDPLSILTDFNTALCDSILLVIDKIQRESKEKVDLILHLLNALTRSLGGLQDLYVEMFILKLNGKWNSLNTTVEINPLYTTFLKFNQLQSFGKSLNYLSDYLSLILSKDTNHRLLKEGLNLMQQIFAESSVKDKPNALIAANLINVVMNPLIEKVLNKNLSPEIRTQSLDIIILISKNVTITSVKRCNEIFQMFNEIVSTRILAASCFIGITEILRSQNMESLVSAGNIELVLDHAYEYLFVVDLAESAIDLLKQCLLDGLLSKSNQQILLSLLVKLCESDGINSKNALSIGQMLVEILKDVDVSADMDSLFQLVAELAKYDSIDEILPIVIQQLLNQLDNKNEQLTEHILKLGSKNERHISKCLAVISVVSRNEDTISSILQNLSAGTDIYFSLVFLNQVVKSIDLDIALDTFLIGLASGDPSTVNMSVRLISTVVTRYSDKYLTEFLDSINRSINVEPGLRCLSKILHSIELSEEQSERVFNLLVETLIKNESPSDKGKLYEVAAECFATLVIKYDLLEMLLNLLETSERLSQPLRLSLASTVKFTFNDDLFLLETELYLLVKYADLTTRSYIFSDILLFKQMGITNLSIVLSKRPNIALPLADKLLPGIMKFEIKPNKAYIRVQTIGPYKHKIDDGITYRKQIFEFIYYLLKVLEDNASLIVLCNIHWELYFKPFFDAGIKDDQSVASICLFSMNKIFHLEPDIFCKHSSGAEESVFASFISRCHKVTSKKVNENAAKQDLENYTTLMSLIIRFLSNLNSLIVKGRVIIEGSQLAEWNNFIKETRTKVAGANKVI